MVRIALRSLLVASLLLSSSVEAAVFTVNSTGDSGDSSPFDGGCSTGSFVIVNGFPAPECTLRAAIQHTNSTTESDTIQFGSNLVPGSDGAIYFSTGGLFNPGVALPAITRPLILDGTTASTYNPSDPGQAPVVTLSGFWIPGTPNGLRLTENADGSQILGLRIVGYGGDGIQLDGADSVRIDRSHVGIEASGGPRGNGGDGIDIGAFSTSATIGRTFNVFTGFSGSGNVISANGGEGIRVAGDSARIAGNLIGTDSTGALIESGSWAYGNQMRGVYVAPGADLAEIGRIGTRFPSSQLASGNTISGNSLGGIRIDSANASVYANKVGTDVSGTIALGNGIYPGIETRAASTTIGNAFHFGAGNLVSGNWIVQIRVGDFSASADDAVISGNKVGVDLNASAPLSLPNSNQGISLVRGDDIDVEGNTVGGLHLDGIQILDGVGIGTSLRDNFVGTNAARADLGNGSHGISSFADTFVSGNIIGFNGASGVFLGASAGGSTLVLNSIGADASGNLFGNEGDGIEALASDLEIGFSAGFGNVIGNNGTGIHLAGDATNVEIRANEIGTNPSGHDVGNLGPGILLDSVSGNIVGSGVAETAPFETRANHVAFNGAAGVFVEAGGAAVGNSIRANSIYQNVEISIDLADPGITPNDPGDFDGGANRRMNFPEFDSAQTQLVTGGDIAARYQIVSSSFFGSAVYPLTVDFYLADVDGEEAEVYLGSDAYTLADEGEFKNIVFSPGVAVDETGFLVATTTDAEGNTSEVSAAIPLPEPGLAGGLMVGAGVLAGWGRRNRVA